MRSGVSVAAEAPRQLDVEGVEVDVADVLEELGGPGVGQGLGQTVSPGLVFLLQGPELGQGRDPPRRPRPRPGRSPLLDRDAGGAAFPEAALALGVGQTYDAIVSVTVTGPITPFMGPAPPPRPGLVSWTTIY